VLTEELARKYFGEEDPIGKIIVDKAGIDVARDSESVPLRVTGVVKKLPFRSHLQFDYLIAITAMEKRLPPEWIFGMTWKGFSTYALLRENTSREQVEARLEDFVEKFYAPWRLTREQALATARFYLQAIPDIHLHSKLEAETSQNSEVVYVYLLSLIAVFILFVAGINFVNISTAQAFYRMKEVGVRKALGARKGQLARQFTAESLLFTALAAGLALLLFAAATPFYEGLTGKDFHYSQVVTGRNLGFVVLLVVTTGVAAGAYPAWFVANFNVVTAIKGKKAPAASVNLVRKGLVVFQFVVAIVMIFSTIVIYQQLRFFNQKKLGFDKEQVIAVRLTAAMWRSIEPLKAALAGESAISAVSLVSSSPGDYYGVFDVYNLEVPFSGNAADIIRLKMMFTDENFLSTLGLTLKEGNNFTKQTAGAEAAYILNEQAVKILKLENPIGKRIRGGDENGRVVGVVKDFHYGSLHENIGGFVIKYATRRDLSNYMLLKIKGSSLRSSLKSVEKTIRRYAPGNTLFYTFLDEKIGRLYQTEARMSQVFEYFAALTVLISCLGLFGLSAYAAQLRLKEIGIRKVFGASVPRVIWELSRDFLWLVLIATLLASPLAWYFMSRWLENFAYRIELDPYLLVLSGVLALVIAFLTISYQTVKAALANPIHSLRTE
jgi:putative ABC transport system permease protein